jgi:NADPH-dependent curcumin reductase CurA
VLISSPLTLDIENIYEIRISKLGVAEPRSIFVFCATIAQRNGIKTGRTKPGDAVVGYIAGKVLESNSPDWKAGDLIGASVPYTTVQAISGEQLKQTLTWKLTEYITEDQISLGVGLLGPPGATAYGGVVDVLHPAEGETVFISAASGAVGSMAGQIAKNVYKCTVIGSCGGPAKCDNIKQKFGYDHAIDYKQCKSADDLIAALKAAAPDGFDMYFEVSLVVDVNAT